MKKSIFNLGKALNKAEQKLIKGGISECECVDNRDCLFMPPPCASGAPNVCIQGQCSFAGWDQ